MNSFQCARDFLLSSARLLERLVFSVLFEGEARVRVVNAIRSYQNADLGLGHALEPDLRCPESQPLFIEAGLSALYECVIRDARFARTLCKFLDSASDESGLVPPIFRNALAAPHAGHWNESGLAPGLNPTIGICGLLHFQRATHPWLDRATATCIRIMYDAPPEEAHTLLGATRLADNHPDEYVRTRLSGIIAERLPRSRFFLPYAPANEYGLTPLHFAQAPVSKWRKLFTDEQIDAHLDDLAGKQQEDGGWPISWGPPGNAAVAEWRGRWTLDAVKVLAGYGRMETRKS